MEKQAVIFRDLGQMDYKEAWDYQENFYRKMRNIKSKVVSKEFGMLDNSFSNHPTYRQLVTPLTELETHALLSFCRTSSCLYSWQKRQYQNVLMSEEQTRRK